ncbi:MAG: non-homologous end-joining DNA ligase [Verrucomicrobiota bacterium]|nr:non-homologous end-joining DNA ligase [Verrucomicrobiota bacterium]
MAQSSTLEIAGRRVKVSNLEKVLYQDNQFTKGQVIDYYIRMSQFILPHLQKRPLTLKRYPNGVSGQHFYEKDAPDHKPSWVKTAAVPRKNGGEDIHYVLVNDLPSLVWAANLASLEMHVFLAKAPKIQQPSAIVFDLDPGPPANVIQCAEVALLLRDLLATFDLQSWVKSSGSKGLQLYVPINRKTSYEQTQPFALALAQHLENARPELIVSKMAKELRTGKVFIDWSQNSEFKTTVAVYSLRAKQETPYVSIPLTWEEVESALNGKDTNCFYYEPEEAIKRVEEKGDLFAPVLKEKQQLPKSLDKMPAVKPIFSQASTSRMKGVGDRSLKAYQAKRDFTQTAEPSATVQTKRSASKPMFVIQKHRASHLHYDFRLEMEGVLKSWAVPKGPPYAKGEKRLAMHVEDHPMSYARFEGTIPKGNYGAGTVMVWDIGTYQITDGDYSKGKLHMILKGKKLKGEWILVRGWKQDSEKQSWFLIKAGESMTPLTPREDDRSVLTKRSLEQITLDNDAQWKSNRS